MLIPDTAHDKFIGKLFVLAVFMVFQTCTSQRTRSRMAVSEAGMICDRIPGLTARQRELCRNYPNVMAAIGEGVRMGTDECQHQFEHQRWNCTAIGSSRVFGQVIVVGSREAAFIYAITSAGVTHAVAAACSRGKISLCGCDSSHQARRHINVRNWKWGGCSVDVHFGMRFSKKFLDAREIEGDDRSLMNLHNNRAGRKVVKMNLMMECKCHGVSGSCTMKTCWKTLPPFRLIGDNLTRKYSKARAVMAVRSGEKAVSGHDSGKRMRKKSLELVLRKPLEEGSRRDSFPSARIPKKSDLVFLQNSPNYCDRDFSTGSPGTAGRFCDRTSKGTNGCDLLCCGRGYNTHQFVKSWQCRCKFHWCCRVNCDTCTRKTEQYTCK